MKIEKITEDGITFEDGTHITHLHEQDCCENVYTDWMQLRDTNILDRDFNKINLTGVKNAGIKLNEYFIPCYDNQNGYYSSNLSLVITDRYGLKRTIDISKYVEELHI